jgi:hypothetical protein
MQVAQWGLVPTAFYDNPAELMKWATQMKPKKLAAKKPASAKSASGKEAVGSGGSDLATRDAQFELQGQS